MKFQEFKITKNYNSIYYFLKDEGFSENFISNLRKKMGNMIVNNTPVNIRKNLCVGDLLKINSNPNAKTAIMHCILPLDIVYEDEYYLLINKPSGISCMPDKQHYEHNLAGGICNYMQPKDCDFVLRIINRLDKDTAGIIIVAKDSISQNKILNIEKSYYAVCHGKIDKETIIDKKIKTVCLNGINQQKRIIDNEGQTAVTHVHPIKYNEDYSLVKLNLIHGRTHQIRVHLSSINHPLVGDNLYGNSSSLINHTALICKEISFFHPYKQEMLHFSVDFPVDFKVLLTKTNLIYSLLLSKF